MTKDIREKIEKIFKPYKLHSRDLDACFSDHVAIGYVTDKILSVVREELLKQLPKEKISSDTKITCSVCHQSSLYSNIRNSALSEVKQIIKSIK